MSLSRGKFIKWSVALLGLVILVGALGSVWFYQQMRASLPQLEGTAAIPGLSAGVVIERDALGVPTVTGATRLDVAQALGWLHAQDRFFQMDLMRRRAAGELAALFGSKAVPADQAARTHGFRRTATEDIAKFNPKERALIEAYTAGVNAGLRALAEKPAEYILLRAVPQIWREEDSILVALAMAMELHDEGNYERSLAALRLVYGGDAADFFAPLVTMEDAALDHSRPQTTPAVPTAKAIDLRRRNPTAMTITNNEWSHAGSNSFALAGEHTASGVAMLANDMHLHLRVPNTWYRASLVWSDDTKTKTGKAHKVTGVTLPGVPLVIAGSNGQVAWGLTNAYADISDIVVVEPSVIARSLYKQGSELVKFERRHEIIEVKGGDPVDHVVEWTEWGPVIGIGDKTRPLVNRWTAHLAGGINLALIELETAQNTNDALDMAHHARMPAQNILIVDKQGNIGWTIAGGLPQRAGYDGRYPVSWAYGDRYWKGMVAAENVPTIVNPGEGRLWTANNRIVGGTALAILGDGGYDQPQRAAQIRDRLETLENAVPQNLLAIQLDDQAPILHRWRQLIMDTLSAEATADHKPRAELKKQLTDWDARARIDSVSYRLVREFRQQTANLVFNALFAPCVHEYDKFNWQRFHYEQPLWTLLSEQPPHLLSSNFNSWHELLLTAVDRVIAELAAQDLDLDEATWGQRNRAQIQHPLARVLPSWLAGWLNLPADPLPGDSLTPRVQRPDFGASERFVVSPGRESEGLFHMPGGQSGHPLSPFYRAGHDAWVRGNPTPFLPGETKHILTLTP